jgi:MEDS: MEthanogen/methylotroph, DcmR Sensory domain
LAPTTAVDRLQLGDHVCWGFDDDAGRLETVARFVAAGIRERHRVLYLTETDLPAPLRTALRDRGIPVDELLALGQLDPAARIAVLSDYVAGAQRDGYAGVRVVADMSDAVGAVDAIERIAWFEANVNPVFAGGAVMAICLYDRRVFSAVQLSRLSPAHPATARPQDDPATWSPLLRAVRLPECPGLRLVGAADAANRYAVSALLAWLVADAVRAGRAALLDLAGLHFADVGAAGAIVAAGRAVPAGLRLAGCRPEIARLITLVGGRGASAMLDVSA